MAKYGRDTEQVINAKALAKMVGVTRQAIRYRCITNSLPHVRLDGMFFFNPQQVNYALHKIEWHKNRRKKKQQELLK